MTQVRVPGDVLEHLRRARDHIDRNFATGVDLAEAADVAGLSKHHFHRLFTAAYGHTPAARMDHITRTHLGRSPCPARRLPPTRRRDRVTLAVRTTEIGPKAKMAAFGMKWGYKAQLDALEELLT